MFEYMSKRPKTPEGVAEELNKLARDGWEPVSIVYPVGGGFAVIVRRPKSQSAGWPNKESLRWKRPGTQPPGKADGGGIDKDNREPSEEGYQSEGGTMKTNLGEAITGTDIWRLPKLNWVYIDSFGRIGGLSVTATVATEPSET